MKKRLPYALLLLTTAAALTLPAVAQLTCTATKSYDGCSSPAPMNRADFSNWSYKDSSGGTHPFNDSAFWVVQETYVVNGHNRTCGFQDTYDGAAYSNDGLYYLQTIVNPPSTSCGGTVQMAGFVNPKFKIVGVEYAPPGSGSDVSYSHDTVVGSSTEFSTTLSSSDTKSISLISGLSLFGFGSQRTATYSTTYSQSQESSTTIGVSQQTDYGTSLSGFSDPTNGVNHDYDYINIWLNPIVTYNLYSSGGKNYVVWTGFGYDLNDKPADPDMDIIGVQLGCLNGHFYQQYPTTNWQTCVDLFNNNFSRSWALTNTDGSGPALTPTLANSSPPYNFCAQTGTDLYYICQADPFSNPTYATQEFPPPSGTYTTKDGRFTACQSSGCSTTIDYQPSKCNNYSQSYSNTVSTSQTNTYGYSTSYSMESQLGWTQTKCTNFCAAFGIDTTNQKTYGWEDSFNSQTNSSQGQTSAFLICGPAQGYTGPLSFTVYQDNLYGTFVFLPVL